MIDVSTIGVVKIGVPKLEKINDVPAVFPFAETWMFVIDDGDPGGPAVSGVNGKHELKIGRLADPLDPGKWSLIAWTTLATDAIDMWHVYARGVHWISYSKEGDTDLTLLALDSSFNLLPGSPWDVFSSTGGIEPLPGGAKTNDHFLATLKGTGASPGGKVSIGVSNPGARVTTIVTASKAGVTTPGVTLAAAIANGSSAEQEVEASMLSARQVNRVYAASTLDPTTTGTVTLFEFDRGWSGAPTASTVLLSTADVNYSMATEVTLGQQGQRLVTYRKIDPLQEKVPEGEKQPDDGRIARQWFGAFTSGTREEELVTSNIAARPHTSTWTDQSSGMDYLMTCWCDMSRGFKQYLLIELITR